MRPTTPRWGSQAESSPTAAQGGVVVGLLGDLGDELGVGDVAGAVDDDHGASEQAGERPVGDRHAVVVAERAAERRRRLDVLDAFRAAEARLGEGQVCGHAQHGESVVGDSFVERPHAGAQTCVSIDGKMLSTRAGRRKSSSDTTPRSVPVSVNAGAGSPTAGSSPTVWIGLPR